MKENDRIEDLLSAGSGLDDETLEKISESCNVLSEEQKNRIFGIIQEKESGSNGENTETAENEDAEVSADVIEFRPDRIRIYRTIAAAAACVCFIAGLAVFLNSKKENIDVGNNDTRITTSAEESKETDASESEEQAEEAAVTEVTVSESSTGETVVYTVTSADVKAAEAGIQETGTAPVTSSETTTVTSEADEKKDLKNLKNDLLPDMKNQSGWNDMMHSKGFNDEQIYLLYASEIFSKFADNVSANMTPEYDRGDSTFLTGYSYESFLELMNFFFTEDAEYRIMSGKEYYVQSPFKYYSAENDNGELRILGATPVCSNPFKAEPEVTESTDTSLKFTYVCSCRAEEYEISEYTEKYDSPEDVIAAFNADNTGEYYGNAFAGLVYDEETGYMRQYKYDEEMVKTEDGWKFRVYTDYKRF